MTQDQHAAFEPCPNPWCNSHKTVDAEIRAYEVPIVEPSRSSFERRVSCPCCPISGPWADTEDEAITAWHTRATPKSSEGALLAAAIYAVEQLADGNDPDLDEDGDEIDPIERLRDAIARAKAGKAQS